MLSSDIDCMAVTVRPATPKNVEALSHVHLQLRVRHRRPHFDGLYLTSADSLAKRRSLRSYPRHTGDACAAATRTAESGDLARTSRVRGAG